MWGQPPSAVQLGKAGAVPLLYPWDMGKGRENADELQRLCDRVSAQAQARGLTEEILDRILNEVPTAEDVARSQVNLKELRAVVAENREFAEQFGLTKADVPRLISETREERPRR